MKRTQLFEFEDFPWLPSWLRRCVTDLIVVLCRVSGANAVLTNEVRRALRACGESRIVDFGSGSGGAMPAVLDRLNQEGGDYTLLMTDLNPNPEMVARFSGNADAKIRYEATPVDATAPSSAPAGLKTMINCFHHLTPSMARAVLESATRSRQPFLAYELAANRVPTPVFLLCLPLGLAVTGLMAVLLTPLVRPLTFRHVLFTYLIPIVPLVYAWDGQASYLRTYAQRDVETLLHGLDDDGYHWEMRPAQDAAGKVLGTVLVGLPGPHRGQPTELQT